MRQTLTMNVRGRRVEVRPARRDVLKGLAGAAAGAAGAAALAGLPAWLLAGEAEIPAGRKLRVGYIGCGSVSGAYLPTLASAPFVELVSACDLIEDRARRAARAHKIPHVFPRVEAMLAGPKFDLLVNTTSMPSHFPVNRTALEAGVNVWSEKPMALEVADARALLDLAARKRVRILAAPTCVLSPQFAFMARSLREGKIGRVTAAHGTYGHGGPTWSAWFYEKGGGSLYDLGVYNVTTLTGLLGPVKEVVGMTAVLNDQRKVDDKGQVKVEADENTMLIMHHGSGVLSHVQTGFVYFDGQVAPTGERKLYTIDVTGTAGSMHVQGWDWEPAAVDLSVAGRTKLTPQCRDPWPEGWAGGARYAARCLLTGEKGLITAEHALHVLEVMNACHESQRTGRRVPVASTFPWPVV